MTKKYKETTTDDLAADLEYVSLNTTPEIISTPASVCSLDSQDSVPDGGITLSRLPAAWSTLKSKLDDALDNSGLAGSFWYEFSGFKPEPKTTFMQEFERLLGHLKVTNPKTKRRYLKRALDSDLGFFYARLGASPTVLDCWQELCQEIGLAEKPASINKCKKALQAVHVSLFNLIDHRRNPDVAIRQFSSKAALMHNLKKNSLSFPRECAKDDGFIRVLLKQF